MRKRKAGMGKRKGGAFERLICVQLSLWITNGKKKDCFWRSAMSGGRATVARRKGDDLARQAGDITATSPEGHQLTDRIYFELKNYNDLEIDSFLIQNKGKLAKFWKDTVKHAMHHKKRPVLIAKQSRKPTIVVSTPGAFMAYGQLIVAPILTLRYSAVGVGVYLLSDILASKFLVERYDTLPQPRAARAGRIQRLK